MKQVHLKLTGKVSPDIKIAMVSKLHDWIKICKFDDDAKCVSS